MFSSFSDSGLLKHHINQAHPLVHSGIGRDCYLPSLGHHSHNGGSKVPPQNPLVSDSKSRGGHGNASPVQPPSSSSLLIPTDPDDSLVDIQPRGSAVHADDQTGAIHSSTSTPEGGSPWSDSDSDDLDIGMKFTNRNIITHIIVITVRCNKIISEIQDLVEPGCNLRFHNIGFREHSYIVDRLRVLDIRARSSYFDDLEQLVIMVPHDTHEALIAPFASGLAASFAAAPLSRGPYSIAVEVATNTTVDCQRSSFMPDLCVQICSLTGSDDLALADMRQYIFMEMAFTQTNADVMKKLQSYITHNPHALTVFKIKVKETYRTPSQSPSSSNVKRFMGRTLLTLQEFKRNSERRTLGMVRRDGISWMNVKKVEFHLWLRLGETPIDLRITHPNHTETAYATGTLYPTRSTADLDALIDRTMSEFKKIIIQYTEGTLASASPDLEHDLEEEEKQAWLEDISSWAPRNPLFDWDYISARFTVSMWKTAHTRYKQWHTGLLKRSISEVDNDEGDRPGNGSQSVTKRANLG
ncbi:hypothetical protein EDD15DRAFT_2374908 [Pisolithus albus]|nr:hypothetical protein EDD15DRAFT_2374908 [Pisolithus albus]